MVLFKINSKVLTQNPTDIAQSKYKLQKVDRAIDGTLIADIIAIKNKVSFTWDYLSTEDVKCLISEINKGGFPTVEYANPDSGELMQIDGHAGEISYAPHYDSRTQSIMWRDIKVSFEER